MHLQLQMATLLEGGGKQVRGDNNLTLDLGVRENSIFTIPDSLNPPLGRPHGILIQVYIVKNPILLDSAHELISLRSSTK